MPIKSLSIRIDEELLKKLRVIAKFEGRSVNRQLISLIRNNIRIYEEIYGEIRTEGETEQKS